MIIDTTPDWINALSGAGQALNEYTGVQRQRAKDEREQAEFALEERKQQLAERLAQDQAARFEGISRRAEEEGERARARFGHEEEGWARQKGDAEIQAKVARSKVMAAGGPLQAPEGGIGVMVPRDVPKEMIPEFYRRLNLIQRASPEAQDELFNDLAAETKGWIAQHKGGRKSVV